MLDEYVEEVKRKLDVLKIHEEDLIIRYVYYDLANRFSFDTSYKPFGNSKKRIEMYRQSEYKMTLNECMRTNKVICKSAAKILEYVLKAFDVDIISREEVNPGNRTPHVYNIIKAKDGRVYRLDLQEDMYLIKMRAFTKNYGMSVNNPTKAIISRFEQESMDRKLGHISSDNYYTDEYLYNLKHDINQTDDFDEKIKFILENIEVYENDKIDYMDRQWYHKTILEHFFGLADFNFCQNTGRIRFRDCYKVINGEKKYFCMVTIRGKDKTDVYVYNQFKHGYVKIDFINFAYAIKNGLVVVNDDNIRDLGKTVSELKKDPAKIYQKKAS